MEDHTKEVIEILTNLKKEDQVFMILKTNEDMKMIAVNISESQTVSLIEYCKARIIYGHFESLKGLNGVSKEKH